MNRLFFLASIIVLSSCGNARLKYRNVEPREKVIIAETPQAVNQDFTPSIVEEKMIIQEPRIYEVSVSTDSETKAIENTLIVEPLVLASPKAPEDTVFIQNDEAIYNALRTEKQAERSVIFSSISLGIILLLTGLIILGFSIDNLALILISSLIAGLTMVCFWVVGLINHANAKTARYSTERAENLLSAGLVILIVQSIFLFPYSLIGWIWYAIFVSKRR